MIYFSIDKVLHYLSNAFENLSYGSRFMMEIRTQSIFLNIRTLAYQARGKLLARQNAQASEFSLVSLNETRRGL